MRYSQQYLNDATARLDGDRGWLGIDTRREPHQLEAGLASNAENVMFRFGKAETRYGQQSVAWATECAVDFPITFGLDATQDVYVDLSALTDSIIYRNYRIQSGTTFQLRHAVTDEFHSIWLETVAGQVEIRLDPSGQDVDSWDYQAFDAANANYRLLDDKTFQLLNKTSGEWHTLYVITIDGNPTVAVDSDGMTTGESGVEPASANYQVIDQETFQLIDPPSDLWHAIYASGDGDISIYLDPIGMNKYGVDFDKPVGLGETFGECVFSDPNDVEGVVLAKQEYALLVRHGALPEQIAYPQDTVLSAPVELMQAFDRVYMFRGQSDTPLVWTPGLDFTNGLGAFQSIDQSAARNTDPDNTYGDGTKLIPNAADATVFNNRIYVVVGKDEVVVSDILDYTRYNEATQQFKINSGSDDRIVRIFPYNQTTLIVFKDQRIHLISNVFGDLGSIRNDILSTEFGLVARDAVVQMGQDVWFLSEDGVFTIKQALDNKLQAWSEPVTGPVHTLMDRVHWDYASVAQAVYDDNRFLLALPIDGSRYNNAILVWDWLSKAWSGFWTAPWMNVKAFVRTNYGARRRLFFVQGPMSGEYASLEGAMFMMNEGYMDRLPGADAEIACELLTRGYDLDVVSQKQPRKAMVDLSTWRPQFSIDAISDGVSEIDAARTSITRDRTKYFVHGMGTYDETNSNDDHAAPFRQDYSVVMGKRDEILLGLNGINPNRMQRSIQPVKLRRRGQYTQIKISNLQGRIAVHGVELESRSGRRNYLQKL